MMSKSKRNQKIHVDKLQTTLDKLEQLEAKPKQELTLRESIYFLRDKLKKALKKGYTYQDLSEILADQEISISAATLKQYLTDISKESKSGKRSKYRTNKKSNPDKLSKETSSQNVTSSKEELVQDLSESEPNKIIEVEQAVNLKSGSLSETFQSSEHSKKKSVTSQSRNRKTIKTRAKELSGSDDDLSSEFNQY